MKISKKITIDEELAIYKNYYFEIPNMLKATLEKKYGIVIKRHVILRCALDKLFGKAWDQCIKRPAINGLNINQFKIVTKTITEYYKQPTLLLTHMKTSNYYRRDRSSTYLISTDLIKEFENKI